MLPALLTPEALAGRWTWRGAVEALRAGHGLPRAEVGDLFLGPPGATLLTRAAAIEGLGCAVKAVTVRDANPAAGRPAVQGAMILFDPETGGVSALLDSALVTEIKTAADSVLGALLLARPEPRSLTVIGAGAVARSLLAAYPALFPSLERVRVWARRPEAALALAAAPCAVAVEAAEDLAAAVASADIVACATMAREPVLRGAWVRPGAHVDLIGAFRADMREADDDLIRGGALFADSRDTTLGHIGEFAIPVAAGVIGPEAVRGDLYDLVAGRAARPSPEAVTVFKNGGGAHLDLMTARHLAQAAG